MAKSNVNQDVSGPNNATQQQFQTCAPAPNLSHRTEQTSEVRPAQVVPNSSDVSFLGMYLALTVLAVLTLAALAAVFAYMKQKVDAILYRAYEFERREKEDRRLIEKTVEQTGQLSETIAKKLAKPISKEIVPDLTTKVAEKVGAVLRPREGEMAEVRSKIDGLRAKFDDGVKQVNLVGSQIDKCTTEISQLRSSIDYAVLKIDEPVSLRQDNAELKSANSQWDERYKELVFKLEQSKSDVEAEQKKYTALESENTRLQAECEEKINTAKTDAGKRIAELQAKMDGLEQEHQNKVGELTKKHEQDLAEKDKTSEAALVELRQSFEGFAPAEICRIFGYDLATSDESNVRTVVYSYLALLGGSLREHDFATRFEAFDRTLFDVLRDDADRLDECRRHVMAHLNPILLEKSGGLQVEWAARNAQFDSTFWAAENDSGTVVECASRAMIYRNAPSTGRVCVVRGRVITC